MGLINFVLSYFSTVETDELRPVNGPTPNQGRVEVYHDGLWGTICDDFMDAREATVICKQLGYEVSRH